MSNANQKIDAEKVVSAIRENLKALREGLDPALLTDEERMEIFEELQELKEMALKAKSTYAG